MGSAYRSSTACWANCSAEAGGSSIEGVPKGSWEQRGPCPAWAGLCLLTWLAEAQSQQGLLPQPPSSCAFHACYQHHAQFSLLSWQWVSVATLQMLDSHLLNLAFFHPKVCYTADWRKEILYRLTPCLVAYLCTVLQRFITQINMNLRTFTSIFQSIINISVCHFTPYSHLHIPYLYFWHRTLRRPDLCSQIVHWFGSLQLTMNSRPN